MSNVATENFDGVTAPALPASMTFTGSWATTTTLPQSALNALTSSANGAVDQAYIKASAGTADAAITADLAANASTTNSECILFIRSSITPVWGSLTAYFVVLGLGSGDGNSVQLSKRVAGTNTAIGGSGGSINPPVTTGIYYRTTLSCQGTTIKVRVQRLSDNNYATNAGAWSATPQDAITVTDSSIAGSTTNFAGIAIFAGPTVSNIRFDNFSLDNFLTSGYVLSGVPQNAQAGIGYTVTATPQNGNGGAPSETVVVRDDLGATIATLSFGAGSLVAQTFIWTPSVSGTRTLTATPTPALGTPSTSSSFVVPALVNIYTSMPFGSGSTGLAGTVGFTVYKIDGTVFLNRATSSISELGSSGTYVSGFSGEPNTLYYVSWDNGSGTYGEDSVGTALGSGAALNSGFVASKGSLLFTAGSFAA